MGLLLFRKRLTAFKFLGCWGEKSPESSKGRQKKKCEVLEDKLASLSWAAHGTSFSGNEQSVLEVAS